MQVHPWLQNLLFAYNLTFFSLMQSCHFWLEVQSFEWIIDFHLYPFQHLFEQFSLYWLHLFLLSLMQLQRCNMLLLWHLSHIQQYHIQQLIAGKGIGASETGGGASPSPIVHAIVDIARGVI